ncbi:MAG TPA: BamA/TamA family outer membrane protein [Cyclobacteriaceae bacterium]
MRDKARINFSFSLGAGFSFILCSKILTLLLLLNSCIGYRYLKDDQKILYNQKIEGNRKFNKEELKQYFTQKRNRRFLLLPFTPYVYIYKWGENGFSTERLNNKKSRIEVKFDKKIATKEDRRGKVSRLKARKASRLSKVDRILQEGNTGMRVGEPLAVYDSISTKNSATRLQLFYRSNGYFDALVHHEEDTRKKRVNVTYKVAEGKPYFIDSVLFVTKDDSIMHLFQETSRESRINKGDIFTQENLSNERERITALLRNKGYFDFSRQYILFQVDSSFGNHTLWVRTEILVPENRNAHKVFTLDSVNFVMDAQVNIPAGQRTQSPFEGITYLYFEKPYSRKIPNRRIFIRKGELYSHENTLNTQRQLLNMNNFKFININYDTTGGKFVANIFATLLDEFQISNEVGINYSDAQGFPGPFYNLSLLRRNAFRTLENFETSFRIGLEGVASATSNEIYRSIEAGGTLAFTFPQFILPIGRNNRLKLGRFNPKTRLQTGYTYNDRPEYRRSNFNLSNTYTWENKRNAQYRMTIGDLSIINSELDSAFEAYLIQLQQRGNNLINTFDPSIVGSIIFSPTFNINQYGSYTRNSTWLRLWIENGGLIMYEINKRYLETFGLEGYKFVKASLDYRKHRPRENNSSISFRFSTGFAYPYSNNKILPYEKYFFAGGSNSVRGWRPRRLGPGSYTPYDSTDGKITYRFEQQGEVLIESSLEFRQKIAGILAGALFLDAGNIWTIRDDPNRPGSQFKINKFYKEIALAGGAGIRFDFSFLVIRFDLGYKLYDPARPVGRRFFLDPNFNSPPFDRSLNREIEPWILNIGIGFPF